MDIGSIGSTKLAMLEASFVTLQIFTLKMRWIGRARQDTHYEGDHSLALWGWFQVQNFRYDIIGKLSPIHSHLTWRFATIKLYKATLDTFPGATYLFEGAMQFISTFLILVLYFVVKRHERLHGAIGEHQNSKITKTAISRDDSGIEGDLGATCIDSHFSH